MNQVLATAKCREDEAKAEIVQKKGLEIFEGQVRKIGMVIDVLAHCPVNFDAMQTGQFRLGIEASVELSYEAIFDVVLETALYCGGGR